MKSANILRLLLVLAFFFTMSALDYVVHGVLYGYGLSFSYSWAIPYWAAYNLLFVLFAFSIHSYLPFLLWFGGFQDILWFMWARDLSLRVWWWHPMYWLGLTFWCLPCQVIMLGSVLFLGWLATRKLAKYRMYVVNLLS